MRILSLALFALVASITLRASENSSALVIHEWGTFTSLQNEYGESVGGVNNEDEPLPRFVHSLGTELSLQTRKLSYNYKGMARTRPDVTMRLETPVVYFHLPQGVKETRVDLNVKFNSGYLTQFFPKAVAIPSNAEGVRAEITTKTVGELTWKNLLVGTQEQPPETDSQVWLAPRKVKSAMVQAQPFTCQISDWDKSENKAVVKQIPQVEQYLFYRGVGRLNAPLSILRDGEKYTVRSTYDGDGKGNFGALPDKLWLVDIAEDGTLAVKKQELTRPKMITEKDNYVSITPMAQFEHSFAPNEYQEANRETLKKELKNALMEDGMYADEADALLATWDASYFKAPGLRVFFMVPQEWTDKVLPLEVKSQLKVAPIKRAMVARIELITPEQREIAGKIVASGAKFYSPEIQKLYMKLGRFRNVILLDVKNQIERMIGQY